MLIPVSYPKILLIYTHSKRVSYSSTIRNYFSQLSPNNLTRPIFSSMIPKNIKGRKIGLSSGGSKVPPARTAAQACRRRNVIHRNVIHRKTEVVVHGLRLEDGGYGLSPLTIGRSERIWNRDGSWSGPWPTRHRLDRLKKHFRRRCLLG